MPETISIRQQICTKVASALAGINGTGSYKLNLASVLKEWAAAPAEDDKLYCSWRDTSGVVEWSMGREKHTLTIDVYVFTNTAANTRKGIADVTVAFGVDKTWGGLAIKTFKTGESMDAMHKQKFNIGAKVTFTIEYLVKYLDPYNQ